MGDLLVVDGVDRLANLFPLGLVRLLLLADVDLDDRRLQDPVGIRRDEEATRAKERVFSPRGTEGGWDVRDQPPEFWDQFNASPPPGAHLRIHPILHWTEADIWAYTRRENIPIIPLYLARGGKRYRSLGDADITFPVNSTAASVDEILIELAETKVPERSGRALDHETEDAFERLRVAGYL